MFKYRNSYKKHTIKQMLHLKVNDIVTFILHNFRKVSLSFAKV